MNKITENIYVTNIPEDNKPCLIEGKSSLILIDPGYDKIISDDNYIIGSLERIKIFEHNTEKPLKHVIFTHSHYDHIENAYLYKKLGMKFNVYAHKNNEFGNKIDFFIDDECLTTNIDGIDIEFIHSPGHSERKDDICIYVPSAKLIFCGDIAQPQGKRYKYATSISPVPYFYFGDDYMNTLKKLLDYDFNILQTGHGSTFLKDEAKNSLDTTLVVLIRIEELAEYLVNKHLDANKHTICEWIYDTISYERNFINAQKRKVVHYYDNYTEYEYFDKPGILYFVEKYKELL